MPDVNRAQPIVEMRDRLIVHLLPMSARPYPSRPSVVDMAARLGSLESECDAEATGSAALGQFWAIIAKHVTKKKRAMAPITAKKIRTAIPRVFRPFIGSPPGRGQPPAATRCAGRAVAWA